MPFSCCRTSNLMSQVGSALSYAHRTGRGVIHRDIKSANIMVNHEGDAFVTDFGISKISESQSRLTQTGATIGTPEYMSPEQCRGETLTGASDQYALGILAYEMLCGETPFSGAHYAIMMAHTSEQPKPIRETRPDCPADVADAVDRMLAKGAEERWPDLDMAVSAMGGGPLGYKDPTRTKIVALIASTQGQLSALDTSSPLSPVPGSVAAGDAATSVTVTGLPSRAEAGDAFTLQADVRGSGDVPITGLGVHWASTDPSIATVEGGRVDVLRAGAVSISAAVGPVASSVLLTIGEPAAASVHVSPGLVKIQEEGSIKLSAQVQDRHGRDLARDVRWLSSDSSVAWVTQEGEVVGAGSGSVAVTAESEGVTGTAEIVVEAPVAEPAPPVEEAPARHVAAPHRRRPGQVPERPWYRHPASMVASIAAVLGLSSWALWSALGPGDSPPPPPSPEAAAIPATVVVDPPVASLPVGDRVQLTAIAVDSDGGQLAGLPVQWRSGAPDIVAVDSLGLVEARAEGTVQVSAVIGGVEAVALLTVRSTPTQAAQLPGEGPVEAGERTTQPQADPVAAAVDDPSGAVEDEASEPPPQTPAPPTPAGLRIALPSTAMDVGRTQDASAQVFDSGGGRMAPGAYTLSWRSSNTPVISVSRAGAVSAGGIGTAWLVAVAGNARDSVLVTVAAVTVAVEIDQSDISLVLGTSRGLSASVLGPNRASIDRPVMWSSSDPGVATVDAGTGQVATVGVGVARITASVDGVAGEVTVSVEAPAPVLPSTEEIQSEIASYVGVLSQANREGVMAYWAEGADAEEGREELNDLLGQSSFSATLGSVEDPILTGEGADVAFEVAARWRSFAGSGRERTLRFRAQFVVVGSEWQLTSCVLQPSGEL